MYTRIRINYETILSFGKIPWSGRHSFLRNVGKRPATHPRTSESSKTNRCENFKCPMSVIAILVTAKIQILSTNICKTLQYEISWKYVHRFSSCYRQKDKQDRHGKGNKFIRTNFRYEIAKEGKLAENYIAKYVIRLHCISLYLISWSDKATISFYSEIKVSIRVKKVFGKKRVSVSSTTFI